MAPCAHQSVLPPAQPPYGRGTPALDLEAFTADASPGRGEAPTPHPGCWGAGGWAGGKATGGGKPSTRRVGGDPEQAIDPRKVRADFRRQLLSAHHTIARAWTKLDRDSRGRISFFELCRSCREMGYSGSVRTLWSSLDVQRKGFVSFHELDADVANFLEALAICLWSTCGTVEAAWRKHFNQQGTIRCNLEGFRQGCAAVGFPGDADTAYEALNSDLGKTGLSMKEFRFLELWFAPEETKPVSVLHEKAEKELSARRRDSLALPVVVKKDPLLPKKNFKALLLKSYGNYVRAWREGLDRDHNGVMDYEEFRTACADVGYPGPRKELWNCLDNNASGGVSLLELDENTSKMLRTVLECAERRYNSWAEAWERVMDVRGDDRVDLYTFAKGCRAIGYGGNPERIFELLDMDRAGYLSFAATSWISGEDVVENHLWEDVGDKRVTGMFKKETRSQARKEDFHGRDRRLRDQRVAARERGEIAGGAPAAKVTATALRRSQSVASSLSPPTGKPPNWGPLAQIQDSQTFPSTSQAGTEGLSRSASMPSPSLPSTVYVGSTADSDEDIISPKARSRKPVPSSPGKGGWTSSKMGMARMVNKQWRETSQDCNVAH
eukprot:TRINITY_DN67977_c0_g1_i1.p1 TRINITY_DN67977_c0_g1~~TRINITY_DN67977_c0_g1_i1.p1  ORF type:complete len:609 (+),score=96.80 TRINITY_DN67977_c0_g1_i1:158-1984(+)